MDTDRSPLLPVTTEALNSHSTRGRAVQLWTKFVDFSSVFAVFVDPMFFFLIFVNQKQKCLGIDGSITIAFVIVRSLTDVIFFLNVCIQFRKGYIDPESRIIGAGELVNDCWKIGFHYLRRKFWADLIVMLPVPQILIYFVMPRLLGQLNTLKKLVCVPVFVHYFIKLVILFPSVAGQTPTGFIFETSWANFIINLLIFMLAGHVVGSCWYLFGLMRLNQCLTDACDSFGEACRILIHCGHGNNNTSASPLAIWRDDVSAEGCFREDGFPYGIYLKVVNLTSQSSLFTRYSYSLFWGFQQIVTLTGTLVPSYFLWEIYFTMSIIGVGLLLFAVVIVNMQNFLQALSKRRMKRTLRQDNVEQWMSHRQLPGELRRRVIKAERFSWAATGGVDEDFLIENMPDDLQRDIRRHLFQFIERVRIFSLMDESFLDAIRQRLKQRRYIRGNNVLNCNGLVEEMVFIVRGKMKSIGPDGLDLPLSEGDPCGEELFTWCLEHSAVNPDGTRTRTDLRSSRTVTCVTNVEAFSLNVADLEEVISLFSELLMSTTIQAAIRYESLYWRARAALQIQKAWRCRKRLYTPRTSFSSSC